MSKFKVVNGKAKRWGKVSLAVGIIGVVGVLALTNKEIEVKANGVDGDITIVEETNNEYIPTKINVDKYVQFVTYEYRTIETYNNVFTDSPEVTNLSQDGMYLEVVSEKGGFAYNSYIAPYSMVIVKNIPWDSGRVTFSGMGTTNNTYRIAID